MLLEVCHAGLEGKYVEVLLQAGPTEVVAARGAHRLIEHSRAQLAHELPQSTLLL